MADGKFARKLVAIAFANASFFLPIVCVFCALLLVVFLEAHALRRVHGNEKSAKYSRRNLYQAAKAAVDKLA